jgi:hypothetical protein
MNGEAMIARPNYPAALLDLLIEDAKLAVGDPVADFGAGTGIFTGSLHVPYRCEAWSARRREP